MQKKEEKCVKKRVVKENETTEYAKRILFSKDFYNLNIDIAVKNKQDKKKDEVELIPENDINKVEFIQEKGTNKVELKQEQINKEKKEINKENYTEKNPKENLNFKSIKIKK